MGLFLQKVNIIRDYLEDFVEGRTFWPQEIWKKHMGNLGDMAKPENKDIGLNCLNEMVFNALQHVPDSMTYLSKLRDSNIFFFCALPQVMAIATLAKVYNNENVFTGVVKIRKGTAALLFEQATTMDNVREIFSSFTHEIKSKVPKNSPQRIYLAEIIDSIQSPVGQNAKDLSSYLLLAVVALFCSVMYLLTARGLSFPRLTDSFDVAIVGVAFFSVAFLMSFGLSPFASATESAVDRKNK